jgi:site-specific DNA recombinase
VKIMEDRQVRPAIYARVSSEQQAQQNTIASQVEALRERVAADRFVLEEELCFIDDGYSGSTLLRPALERLRDVAYAGGFERLYVHAPDRLARKYAYQVLLVEELQRAGVELIFLNQKLGASAEEDLCLQMQGMIAEYERARILERSRRGKRHAARRGLVNVLSGAPYGYRYVAKHEGGGQAYYQVIFEEARVVRQVFEWVGRDRLSIGEVCRRLKQQGVATRTGKDHWDRTTVWAMLKNPAYQGTAAFGKTRVGERRPQLRSKRHQPAQPRRACSIYDTAPEEHLPIAVPAIVSEELFAAVQEQLAENRQRSRERRRGARHLLQGLVQCGHCGYAYYGKRVSRSSAKGKVPYAYYRCVGTDAYRFGGKRVCPNTQVRTDMLDEVVWKDVCALLRDPAQVQREYERRLDRPEPDEHDRRQLDKQIAQQRRTISRLIDAYEDGLIEKSEFEPRVGKAKERLARLQAEATAAAERQAERVELQLVIGHLEEFAQRVQQGLEAADCTTRREIIRALVKTVKIEDSKVRISYRISPPPFDGGPAGGPSLPCCWRRDDAALRCPRFRERQAPILQDARIEPFADQSKQHPVPYPQPKKLAQMSMIQSVKELTDVHLQDPAAIHAHGLPPQRIERLVRRPSWPKAVRTVQKVLLVDGFQDHDDRPLKQLVFKRGNPQRPGFWARPLGNVHPPHRRCPVRAGLGAVQQGLQVAQQVLVVVLRRLSVHARGAVFARAQVRCDQPVHVDVVSQRGESHLRRLLRQLGYPLLSR